ncbi:sulfite exporter TauE/SafE family protein [Flavobacterium difficile]|uniref:Probable membrane transporter protein n=1 Tax=Flavobacterium difficile TaxID=2709659 RepID=A0ABX0I8J2_9FLAO|nr:sulfite exporter TauE/SafE family protein [Flavobacterium difficile]NHM02966.1 sulfite exporter TauE/SafE family protein [Flavobacterium difficile]
MEIIGFFLSVLIGISLGLLGSGGSILTIPILVYVFHLSPSDATVYSLFVVGTSSLAGTINGAKHHLLDYKTALYFGLPSVFSIFFMRQFIVPFLPEVWLTFSKFRLTTDLLIMALFSVLMILASFSMIKKREIVSTITIEIKYSSLIIKGVFIGLLTGFVGVGGGFLIIPTLLFSAKLPMKNAVATSLVIIVFNSLLGFLGSLTKTTIHWDFLLLFSAFAIVGVFIGMYISKFISNEKLKPIFGWFVLLTGIYIVMKEIVFKFDF